MTTSRTLHETAALLAAIELAVQTGDARPADIEAAVALAIGAKDEGAAWALLQARARAIVATGMEAGGIDGFTTASGAKAVREKPVTVVRWDAHALDAVCASLPDVAAIIAPHRRETVRAGALRIARGSSVPVEGGTR